MAPPNSMAPLVHGTISELVPDFPLTRDSGPISEEENGTMATEAYCVKCREKREMKDEQEVTMKNGRDAISGVCSVCGTKLFRMVGKKAS
jgi:hypothetical protein